MHGLVALDADDAAPARDPLERPAHGRRVRRDRGADRARPADRTDREPRPTGFTAPKLLWLRTHEPDVYARIRTCCFQGLRAAEALRGTRDRRGGRLGDAALRRRAPPLERGGRGCARDSGRVAASRVRVARGRRRRRPGGRGARRGRHRAGSGVRRARHVRRRLRDAVGIPSRPGGARARVLPRGPGTWHAMGVMLSAAGSLQWLRDAVRPASPSTARRRGRGVAAGSEGLFFAPYLAGERTPHADPDARGAFVGLPARRPRRTRPGGARRRRVRPARLARAAPRARVQPEIGRVSGGGARSDLWRAIVASVLGLPLETTAAEEGSAFGAALLAGTRRSVADPVDAAARCVHVRGRTNPDPTWTAPTRRATRGSAGLSGAVRAAPPPPPSVNAPPPPPPAGVVALAEVCDQC